LLGTWNITVHKHIRINILQRTQHTSLIILKCQHQRMVVDMQLWVWVIIGIAISVLILGIIVGVTTPISSDLNPGFQISSNDTMIPTAKAQITPQLVPLSTRAMALEKLGNYAGASLLWKQALSLHLSRDQKICPRLIIL
jgi:hypothetical protein